MRKVFFASVAILLIVFWLGCGENGENPLAPPTLDYLDYSLNIDKISGSKVNEFGDYRVEISFTIENHSDISLPLTRDAFWLEDSNDEATYYKYLASDPGRGFLNAPQEILPGGRVHCKILYKMSDEMYKYKKAEGPFKFAVEIYKVRRGIELPPWEEIKGIIAGS